MSQNISTTIVPSAYVLHEDKPEAVARSMIENGNQQQCFYIFDMDEAYYRIQHFKNMMPRVQVYYEMKSNDSMMLVKLIKASGLGFDCGSPWEIHALRQLNVSPMNMIYSMSTKTPEQMKYARETGIKVTTFDNTYELKKLQEYWPEARLLLHVRVESDNDTTKNLNKLGCTFEEEAITLLEEAASLGLRVVGVSLSVDSDSPTYSSYLDGLRYAKALFEHEAKAGRIMTIVDIGEGFVSNEVNKFDKVSKLINVQIEELFPDPNVHIIAKPGRYICDTPFTLYCSISDIRKVKKGDKMVNMIYMNDGVYGTMRYFESWHDLRKFKKTNTPITSDLEQTILWGPSCDSYDRVVKGSTVLLPPCSPQDWLVIRNHGAYTFTFATKFSSMQIPLIRPVISSNLWLKLKDDEVFTPKDFIMHPDMSQALPMTTPPIPKKNSTKQQPKTYTLSV